MNCRTFAKTLYDFQDGALTASEKAEFELHRSGCARCAARMEAESRTARMVRTAVEDACEGLEFGQAQGRRLVPSRSSPIAGWHIAAVAAALLLMALLLPPIVRKPAPERANASESWTQEIDVTYEAGLVAETVLISHDSGKEAIIEMRVSYYP